MAEPRTFKVKPRTLQTTFPPLVPIILFGLGNKLGDNIPVQFIRHIT